MSKIVFVVQHLGQPRCVKRIISVKDAGFEVMVHGFDQGNYSENIKLLAENDIPVSTSITSKGLSKIKKILDYIKLVVSVSRKIEKEDTIYAFGFEMATSVRCFTRKRYIYECADVVAAREHNRIMKRMDEKNIHKSCFTVFTSEGFADFFWGEKRFLDEIRSRYILLPNRLSPYFFKKNRPVPQNLKTTKLRFGFVGLFRFMEIYMTFCEVLGNEYPNYEFHFWGDSNGDDKEKVIDLTQRFQNIFYHGSFVNPNDLERVYDSFDVCVTCYNTASGNVMIAEPNKLYESIYFCKPIIVSKGTFLGKKVENLNVGKAIYPTKEGISDFLATISTEELNKMADNERKIGLDELIDNSAELNERIATIIKTR